MKRKADEMNNKEESEAQPKRVKPDQPLLTDSFDDDDAAQERIDERERIAHMHGFGSMDLVEDVDAEINRLLLYKKRMNSQSGRCCCRVGG